MDIKNLPWYGQIGIFALVGIGLFALFYFAHYEGTQGQIDRVVKDIERLNREIYAKKQLQKELVQIRAEIAMNKKKLKELDQILPKEKNISDILVKIQSIISGTQMEFKKMSKAKRKNQKLFTEFSYTINAQGSYHNLGTFFDQLSNLKKIFNITDLRITPNRDKNFNPQFTINTVFRVSTYIQRIKKKKKRKG